MDRTGKMPRSILGLKVESADLLHLDMIRFVAAITVVIYHFRNQAIFGDVRGSSLAFFDNWSLAVSVFFVISGIVISFVYHERYVAKDFWVARLARLAPLHYATLFAYAGIGLVFGLLNLEWQEQSKIDATCFWSHLTFTQSLGICDRDAYNHVSWSISAEMAAYAAFPVLLAWSRRQPRLMPIIAMALPFLATLIIPSVPEPWFERTFNFGVLRGLIDFTVGVALFSIRDRLAALAHPRIALAGASAIVLVGMSTAAFPGFVLLVACYALVAFAYAADLQGRNLYWATTLAPLGALTYGIYMLHPLVRTFFLSLFLKMGLSVNVAVVLDIGVVIIAAYVSYFLFETPMRRAIRTRFSSNPAHPATGRGI